MNSNHFWYDISFITIITLKTKQLIVHTLVKLKRVGLTDILIVIVDSLGVKNISAIASS